MKIRFAVAPEAGVRTGERLIAFAEAVERRGFDGVWLSDVPLGPTVDPLVGLALIAGRTRVVRLGANVVPLGRNPFLLAKALAQLDQLSDGRLLLSFVPGIDHAGDRRALGWDGPSRGAVLEDTLARVRVWWTGQEAYGGVEPGAEELAAIMRPFQDPLEVWLGGRVPQALERAGRIADGWLGALVTAAEARAARERIQAAAERAGRWIDPEHFGLSLAYARDAPEPALLSRLERLRDGVDPLALLPVGAAALRAQIEQLLDAGLSKFVLRPVADVGSWDDEAAWLGGAILDLQG